METDKVDLGVSEVIEQQSQIYIGSIIYLLVGICSTKIGSAGRQAASHDPSY